jgi:hypothetical protein
MEELDLTDINDKQIHIGDIVKINNSYYFRNNISAEKSR